MTASALPNSVDAMLELLASHGYLAERSLATVTYLFEGAMMHGRQLSFGKLNTEDWQANA